MAKGTGLTAEDADLVEALCADLQPDPPPGWKPGHESPPIGTSAHLLLSRAWESDANELAATWQDTKHGPFWVGEITVPSYCVLGWKPMS